MALALVVFVAAVWPALGAFWTADDFVLLTVGRSADLGEALRYFTTDWGGHRGQGGYYRPIVNLSVAADEWLHGLSPLGFRLTNLALHVAASVLVFLVARDALRLRRSTAGLAALLFLLHPMHDQAVLWISGRTDLLATVFYLLAFRAATAVPAPSTGPAVLFFGLALLSKEMAVTLPGLLLLYHVVLPSSGTSGGVDLTGTPWRRIVPFCAVLAGYIVCRTAILGGIGGDPAFLHWGAGTVKSAAKLLLWNFVPWDLGAAQSLLRAHPPLLYALGALTLVAGLGLLILSRRAPPVLFALAWVVLALSPVYNRPAAWYTYLPSVGACWSIAAVLERAPMVRAARAAASTGLAVAFLLGLRGNARTIADAGAVARAAVEFLGDRDGPTYLLNAPIALKGRIPILAGDAQYRAALTLSGRRGQVAVLNHVYLSTRARAGPRVVVGTDTIETAVDTDADTFFTLDGPIPDAPASPRLGERFQGRHALYEVAGLDEQGKIDRLVLRQVGELLRGAGARLAAYADGQFREIRGSPETVLVPSVGRPPDAVLGRPRDP